MNITNIKRFRRCLALTLTFVVSGCAQLLLLSGGQVRAAIRTQQESATNKSPRYLQSSNDLEDTLDASISYASNEGPMIRVALMTDVASASISSSYSSASSGLIVNHASEGFRAEKISGSSLHIELRKQIGSSVKSDPLSHSPSPMLPSPNVRYSVFVGSSSDARNARTLEDRLKSEFFEPVTTIVDAKTRQYVVTIGHFTSRDNAEAMVRVLHNAGYKAPVIVSDPGASPTRDLKQPELTTDTNARAAKRKAQSGAPAHIASSSRGVAQILAITGDKVIASSESELVVEAGESQSDRTHPVPSLHFDNKDYRGEIHFILSPRGKINVVNVLPLELYLRGVVPMEMSATAYEEVEAIKAQAIASRSFALASLGQHRNEGYDLADDTRSQVYGGLSAEREVTNRAIEETKGIVAAYPNDSGKLEPIQALFTANCGGRTENNDEVFGGRPLPYLRSVACVTDRQSFAGHDIVTNRTVEAFTGNEGRSVSREVALLSVLGFSLPRRVSNHYLHGSLEQDESRSWTEQLGRIRDRDKPPMSRGDASRLAEFTRLLTAAVYGEDRIRVTSPAEVDYLLSGIRVEQLSREGRADIAILLKDGIFRIPDEGTIDGHSTLTRAQAIEMIGRAVLSRSSGDLKSRISNLKSEIHDLRLGTAGPAERGRLILAKPPASSLNAGHPSKAPGFVSVNASSPGKLATSNSKSTHVASTKPAGSTVPLQDTTRRIAEPEIQLANSSSSFDIAEGAWLFRAVSGESYAVDRLTLAGGERVAYHVNGTGRVDFLEASLSDRGAFIESSDNVAPWQQRVTIEELQQRLARAHINVGRPEHIEPVVLSASSRITEVELTGSDGHARLRIPQIRGALGLKEHLFTIDRETDSRDHLVAFVFTGRGSGHGVGMCQAGAYRMADAGYSYIAILQKYYTGIEVHKTY